MGNTQAYGMAEAVSAGQTDLKAALHYHLRANHYPPLPVEYIGVAEQVIEQCVGFATEGSNVDILLPEGLNPLPREAWQDDDGSWWCSVDVLASIMHLWPFIESRFEDIEDNEDD